MLAFVKKLSWLHQKLSYLRMHQKIHGETFAPYEFMVPQVFYTIATVQYIPIFNDCSIKVFYILTFPFSEVKLNLLPQPWFSRGYRIYPIYVTLSHLRSKEITGIHKPCIPHSNAVLQLNTNRFRFKCNTGTWLISSVHNSLI